jgi:phosphate starvation-inducible protein PhoH
MEDIRNSVERAEPNMKTIEKAKRLAAEGNDVIIWSARGRTYAEKAAKKFGIPAIACLGKPNLMVDDHPERLRKRHVRRIIDVKVFNEEE